MSYLEVSSTKRFESITEALNVANLIKQESLLHKFTYVLHDIAMITSKWNKTSKWRWRNISLLIKQIKVTHVVNVYSCYQILHTFVYTIVNVVGPWRSQYRFITNSSNNSSCHLHCPVLKWNMNYFLTIITETKYVDSMFWMPKYNYIDI